MITRIDTPKAAEALARQRFDESELGWFVICRACRIDYIDTNRRRPGKCGACGSDAIATMVGTPADYLEPVVGPDPRD